MTSKNKRVSPSTVAGIDIPTSRVKYCFNEIGVNKHINNALFEVEELRKREVGVSELAQPHRDVLENAANTRKDRSTPWGDMTHEQATTMLENSKYRISHNAVVALATVVDEIVHELGFHTVEQALIADKTNVEMSHLFTNVQSLKYYPLLATMETFQQYEKRTDEPEQPEAEPVDALVEDKVPRASDQFMFYVSKIVKKFATTNGEGKNVTRITKLFRQFVSDLIREFVSVRTATIVRVLVNVCDVRTVNVGHVRAAIEIMLRDSCQRVDPAELLDIMAVSVDRWNVFSKDRADNKDLDVAQYAAEERTLKMPDVQKCQELASQRKQKAPRRKRNKPAAVVVEPELTAEESQATEVAAVADIPVCEWSEAPVTPVTPVVEVTPPESADTSVTPPEPEVNAPVADTPKVSERSRRKRASAVDQSNRSS